MSESRLLAAPAHGIREGLHEHYEKLWLAAIGRIRTGDLECDPVLAARQPDRRRGLTVIARPSPKVRQRVMAFLDPLQQLEPAQHYYASLELHVTVLSLFTATVDHARYLARTDQYVAAVDAALRGAPPFRLEFTGVTASPGAILIQGFFDNESLTGLRDALRRQLRARGLTEGLDQRYRLATAHLTAVRFRAPLRDRAALAATLERARQRPFGACTIGTVSFVENDWYMTHARLKTVKCYRLAA